jgi:putative PIG3 family NAD(P)H quinone oxidoreductase
MRAVKALDQKLVLTNCKIPVPKTGEVLVKVHAAGVNRPDLLQRKGLYPPPKGITDILGLEIAGEIIKLGKDCRKFKIGQKICALVAGGGYADYCIVPEAQCLLVPKGMDFITAAAIPETFFTVWTNLFDHGHLKKGETILIHGGTSGIGTTAIQIARAFGAKVIVTAGTDAKCTACKKLGAHAAVNYKTQDFVVEVLKLTKNKGIDVVLDMVGGDYLPRNLKILKEGGRHVSIAMQRGRKAEIDIFDIMSKRLVLTGSTLRAQPVAVKGLIAKALTKNIFPLLAAQKIKPVIHKVFPLEQAQSAHDYLESGDTIGKIVLCVAIA